MQTYLDFPDPPLTQSTCLTIGNFDGVHRGHQQLVSGMIAAAHAAGCLAGLLTFDPHPLTVLRPDASPAYLTSPDERAEVLAALGLDFVLILPFNRAVAALPAAEFMRRVVERIPLCALWVGPDFALGRDREGDATRLAEIGRELGYQLYVTPDYHWQGNPVRSSRIRNLLAQEGAVEQAADLLGRPYQVWGVVQKGARRGRQLGFPTANLTLPAERLLPARGVYACWAWRPAAAIGDSIPGQPAVVNVGIRPTFDAGASSVEAHLLDFDGDLYGELLGLSFIARLREEHKFADVSALITQIQADVEAGRRILAAPPDHAGSWKLEAGDQKLEAGSWGLEAGGWKLGAGDQMLEAGGWKLEAGSWGREAGGGKLEAGGGEVEGGRKEPGAAEAFWTELPHTADWAIHVTGDSQRQLYARAAAAMYQLQDADPARPITLARRFQVAADDPTGLLVAWLNALLLGQDAGGEMYTRFEIHEISSVGLRGVAYGYPGAPTHTAIKAVTYYDLWVGETTTGWEARVTFDV